MSKFSDILLIQCCLFLIPINIYVIGDWLATGVQWGLFRYQQSYFGNSLIFFTKDIYFINNGMIYGRSALASAMVGIATFLLLLACIFLILAFQCENGAYVRAAAIITLTTGCLFLIADMIQYGALFHGPAGFVIPVGVPVILVCGLWMYRATFTDNNTQRSDENKIFG
ncbi:MAG: hypothetical protein ABFC71_06555 [Methanoregula sp.]